VSFASNLKTTAPAMVAASRILGVLALSLAGAGLAQADQHLTRAQVKAQVAEAERTGDMVEPWTKMKLNELYPSEYPTKPTVQAKDQ
jgi:hypothetical protein